MKPQAIQSTAVIGPAFLMFLYLDMHVMSLEQLFRVPIKYIIGKDTNFALIRKAIFDGITKKIFTASRACSFTKKKDQKIVAIHLEGCKEQAHELTTDVRKIIS